MILEQQRQNDKVEWERAIEKERDERERERAREREVKERRSKNRGRRRGLSWRVNDSETHNSANERASSTSRQLSS